MSQVNTLQREKSLLREVIPFPRVDEFYNILQDRLHILLERHILGGQFTMFINALPRKKATLINRYENVPLIYSGIPRQRELLEISAGYSRPDLTEHWNFLDVTHLDGSTAVVSSQLYKEFNLGSYKLEDIPRVGMGRLESYFDSILYPEKGKTPTPRQVSEYHILKAFFNIEEDFYLSIPLIQFGEFDGIVHMVYQLADEKYINPISIGNLIKAFSLSYEDLILAWDLVGWNPEKSEAIQLPINDSFYEQINRNPILKELKYDKYYKKYLNYLNNRIKLTDKVIHSKVYAPYLKTAIISIMIDSYAHNISAHSLVALNWWFKRRAENLRSKTESHYQEVEEVKDILEEYVPKGWEMDRLMDLLDPWVEGLFVKETQADNDVVKYPGSLAREIQPLLKFLMQKGAFWSGIARDNHFGGEARDLFNLLWEDFINNPLYLGTIAKSEDIHKISVHIIHYETAPSAPQMPNCVQERKVCSEGVFVEIDIKNRRKRAFQDEEKGAYIQLHEGTRLFFRDHRELESMSDFVYPGKDYGAIKEMLQQSKLFFPGEVVGRHAFFTMLENEIRNVKHYKGQELADIQKNGLKLYISLEETSVRDEKSPEKELYQIGVWIGTPTFLTIKGHKILVQRKFEALYEDIMDEETFAPRLGGSFQDKICAGMLFNNKFRKVQNGDGNPARDQREDTPRDEKYYPWILPASSTAAAPHQDIVVCRDVINHMDEFKANYNHETGYFKKYFHIWKASNIKEVRGVEDTNFQWENLSRFKFVSLQSDPRKKLALWEKVRSSGVIRIIDRRIDTALFNDAEQTGVLLAYEDWMSQWLDEISHSLQILVDGALVGQMVFIKTPEPSFQYFQTKELEQLDHDPAHGIKTVESIDIAHGGFTLDPSVLRYRSHGIYKTYFTESVDEGYPISTPMKARLIELFEILTTRICIFDNRIWHRIRNNEREELFRNRLKLDIYEEQTPTLNSEGQWTGYWEDKKQKLGNKCHFLILHLSFIEKLLLTKYSNHPDYEDENIGLFIEKEILPIITITGDIRDNFILVITSGRGRTKWWSKLNENRKYQAFTAFTMFRPVESLISGIEDALGRKDDIELKYNLVKVLFGT